MKHNTWSLLYDIGHDGVSMHTFYRKVSNHNATLLVIKDTAGNVFGSFNYTTWKKSKYFYGTGETFLYSFTVRA